MKFILLITILFTSQMSTAWAGFSANVPDLKLTVATTDGKAISGATFRLTMTSENWVANCQTDVGIPYPCWKRGSDEFVSNAYTSDENGIIDIPTFKTSTWLITKRRPTLRVTLEEIPSACKSFPLTKLMRVRAYIIIASGEEEIAALESNQKMNIFMTAQELEDLYKQSEESCAKI